tara:strand:- start:781 stop:948 length:168 start_codon:yes stop_codon:yes gene_type:complete
MENDEENYLSDEDLRLSVHNIYKHRWVWYHTALFCSLMMTNALLIALIVVVALQN